MRQTRTTPAAQAALCFFLSFAAAVVYWWKTIRGRWWPDGDEFALFVNSAAMFHPKPAQWFLRGYRDYLIVYPELSGFRSNFIRPVANITYYFASFVYGTHWDRYILTSYVIFAALVGLAVYVGAKYLRLRTWQTACVALLLFLIPSQDMLTTLYPDCNLDMIASVLVLLGVTCLLANRPAFTLACLTVAVFSKETAYFAPFAAILALFLLRGLKIDRTVKLYAVLFPLPVLAVYVCRAIAFQGSTMGGVYVFAGDSSLRHRLANMIRGVLNWPVQRYTWDVVRISRFSSQWFAINALRLACLGFWILAACSIFLLFRLRRDALRKGERKSARQADVLLVILLFLVGSLALPAALNLSVRFGAIAFPLLTLACFGCATAVGRHRAVQTGWLAMATLLLVLSGVARVSVYRQTVSLEPQWQLNHSLLEQAKTAPPGILLLVDDMTDFDAGTQWFQRFSGFQGDVIRVNDYLQGADTSCQALSQVSQPAPDRVEILFAPDTPCGGVTMRTAVVAVPRHWHRVVGAVSIDYTADANGRVESAVVHLPAQTGATVLQGRVLTHTYRRMVIQAAANREGIGALSSGV